LYNIYLYLYVFIDLHANKYYSIWQFLSYVKKLSARKTCSRTRGSVPAFVVSTGAMIYSMGTFTLLNFLHCPFPSLYGSVQKCRNLRFTKLTRRNFKFNFDNSIFFLF